MTQGNIYTILGLIGLYAFMLARSREVPIHQIILLALGGFLLGVTQLGQPFWLLFLFVGNIFF